LCHALSADRSFDSRLTNVSTRPLGAIGRDCSADTQYNPQCQLTRELFGTSTPLYHRRHYNSRGQLFDVRLGTDGAAINDGPNPAQWTGASWNRGALRMFFSGNLIEYAWPAVASQQNNGNLYRQDHFVPTALDGAGAVTAWMMSADYYCYDSLNRVAQIAEETYTSGGGYAPNVFNQQFSYDRFGNRLVSSATGTGAPNPGYKINGANNRLIAPTDTDGSQVSDRMRYDSSGNLIKDTHTQTGTTGNRTYNAENRMLTADGANGLLNRYTYDADGHRTRREINNGGDIWWQVYGISGELVAEYQLVSGTPTLKKEYGHRNGQLLVIAETTGTLQWVVTDALGTPRMIADQTGSLAGIKRRDYLPFGEEILAGVGHRQPANGYSVSQSQQPRQQFTGKERDSETGLDYFEARYYSSLQGRFTSPDEFTGGPDELYDFADDASDNPMLYAEQGEPQSLNKYQYCFNNPLVYTDIDGHGWKDWVKTGLEVATWVPGPIGQVASGARAVIAVAEGDYQGALEYGAGALGGKGGQLLVKGISKAAKAVDKITDGSKALDKLKDVASGAKRACGNCFTAGTEVSTPKGKAKIEDLRVGDKVTTTNIAKDKPDGWTEVDPKRWRVVKLLMPDPKGSEDVYEIELLRSLKWIREVGAAPRRWIEISLSELGLTGQAKVTAIAACPKIKAGPGRVVLMTVTHLDPGVMEIDFADLKKALEPTVSHPLFSEDRNDWVAAGQLRVGEGIRTRTGTARIEAIRWKKGEHRVYNIEVEADHAYFVSNVELLSHNNGGCGREINEVRRFMSKQELKQIKKEGVKFDPQKGDGIPTTTTNFSPATQSIAKKRTGALNAKYQVDFNVKDLEKGPTKSTKSGLPEYPIRGDLTKDKILRVKKLPE
jgi:RHS repeat-associated protein